MNKSKYEAFLRDTNHTQKGIISRVSRLEKIERCFRFDIDTIIFDKVKVINLLNEIKTLGIDSKNQNLSNAVRKYFECMTNDKIN